MLTDKGGEVKMKEIIIAYDDNTEASPVMGDWVGELIRCKACGDCRQDGYCERWHISVKPDFFCADGDDGNLQEGS